MNTVYGFQPMLTFLMLGAVSAGPLSNLWIWLHRRHDTLHLWVSGWCAVTGAYLFSHYVQFSSVSPERIVLATRLSWVCALFIILVLVGLSQALVRGGGSGGSLAFAGGVSAAMILITMCTNRTVPGQIYERTDRLAPPHCVAVAGP